MTLTLAVATALIATCPAQEIGFLDLTKVAARVDLRRPKATSAVTGGFRGTQQTLLCFNSASKAGALHTSLISLDRTHYQIHDEPTFEVMVENDGSTPVRIPFSPHLADIQPKDPAQKFAHYELQIALWIASDQWSTNTAGSVILYGANNHPHTMLTLNPGEWVRVIGKGHLDLSNELVSLVVSGHPADHMYAEASLYRQETLITPTESASVSREVCLKRTQGQSLPIQLTMP